MLSSHPFREKTGMHMRMRGFSEVHTANDQMVTVWGEAGLSALRTFRLHTDVLCGLGQREALSEQR